MTPATMKVGELAKRTGLTVRTLHHYDEIGLLTPGERTRSGHRLYGRSEVGRLQRIASLKHLGLSLEEIRDCLDRPDYTLERTLELQIRRIDEEIERQTQLRTLIEGLRDRVASNQGANIDQLTRTIQITMNYDKYYTTEQLEALEQRRVEVGEERIQQVQEEWTQLFAAYARAMEDGLDPGSPEVQMLAVKSNALIREFTGGDPGIAASLGKMHRQEGGENMMAAQDMPMAPRLWDYMARARAAAQD